MSLTERFDCGPFEPTLTKQAFKDECDINILMKRFEKSCGTEYLSQYQGYVSGSFGDFTEVGDYRGAIEQIRQADEIFMALPAIVRSRFQNDAATFLDFCQDPRNLSELRQMGLAKPVEIEAKSGQKVTPPHTPPS